MRLFPLLLTVLALAAAGALSAGCQKDKQSAASPPADTPPFEGTVVAMGDSLTAGYGVPEGENYPSLLEKKLRESGYRWRVVNAGISGETSSGALSRVDWVLKLKPDIVILETGANDGLRGIDPRLTHSNIDKTVARLQEHGVVVVLAGMRMLTNLGPSFTQEFGAIYPQVAAKHQLTLVPFFLAGVAGDPRLNLPDGIHPVGKGYRIITDMIYPYLLQGIEKSQKMKSRG